MNDRKYEQWSTFKLQEKSYENKFDFQKIKNIRESLHLYIVKYINIVKSNIYILN